MDGVGRQRVPLPWLAGRGRTAAIVATVVVLVVLAVVVTLMLTVPFSGDEQFYVERARAIAELLRGEDRSLVGVTRYVVHNGWFMPGMSLVLAPLYVVVPNASVEATRLFAAGVHAVLWGWAAWELRRAFGRSMLVAFLVFPTTAVMWLVFALTTWADPAAGLVLAVVAARAYRIACCLLERRPVPLSELLVAELAMVLLVYLRGNMIGVVAAVHAILSMIALMPGRTGVRIRDAARLAAGIALFATLLAPWSLAASDKLGGPVVTTSSSALAVGVTFGHEDRLCFGPCPPEGVWAGELQFSRQYAREHGISQLEAQRRMAANALEGVSFADYSAQVRENALAFVAPTGDGPRRGQPFMARFATISDLSLAPSTVQVLDGGVRSLTLAVYVPFFAALVIANFGVFVSSRRRQVTSLLVKGLTAALFIQPFVHQSHARYWTGYATVMALAAALLLAVVRSTLERDRSARGWGVALSRLRRLEAGPRFLALLQGAYAVGLAIVVGLVVLG